MQVDSHRLIGKTIARLLATQKNIRIKERDFKYGCMKPDIDKKLRSIPHYCDKSLDFVQELVEKLSVQKLSDTAPISREYTINLGVVVHYVCDYFCFAHNSPQYDSLLLHFIYESRLAKMLSRLDLNSMCKDIIDGMDEEKVTSDWCFSEYILNKHHEYMTSRKGIFDDIAYSLEACLTVILCITAKCMKNQEEAAA